MEYWSEEDAGRRLDELLEATVRNGPQMVTRGGVETVVMVSIEEWRRLTDPAGPLVEKPSGSNP
jgi:prevent-host-death family protein